jgi:hypothetical protein
MMMTMTTKDNYRHYLVKFMKHLDRDADDLYTLEMVFTPERLMEITPSDVCRFFKLLAYGKEVRGWHDLPTHCRSSMLSHWKRALSSFMPSKFPWDPINRVGNPTKSEEVKAFIRKVRRFER